MSEIKAQKLALVSEVVEDWPQEEVDTLRECSSKSSSTATRPFFKSRDKDIARREPNVRFLNSFLRPFLHPRFALWAMPMSQSTFTILLGGALSLTDRLRDAVREQPLHCGRRRHAACDGARRGAGTLGRRFRFHAARSRRRFSAMCRRQPYPAAKASDGWRDCRFRGDRTRRKRLDLLRVRWAVSGPTTRFSICSMPSSLAEQGYDVLLTSGEEEAVPLLPGTLELDLPQDSLFSVPGFSELARPVHRKRALSARRFPFALRLVAHHFQCGGRHRALHACQRPRHRARPPL